MKGVISMKVFFRDEKLDYSRIDVSTFTIEMLDATRERLGKMPILGELIKQMDYDDLVIMLLLGFKNVAFLEVMVQQTFNDMASEMRDKEQEKE